MGDVINFPGTEEPLFEEVIPIQTHVFNISKELEEAKSRRVEHGVPLDYDGGFTDGASKGVEIGLTISGAELLREKAMGKIKTVIILNLVAWFFFDIWMRS